MRHNLRVLPLLPQVLTQNRLQLTCLRFPLIEPFLRLAVGPVQPRQGLHRVHAAQLLVHVHGMEQGLVEAGLKLVGHDVVTMMALPDSKASLS